MLSAIGGTMGLLTGFSIISGVEIIYFAFKIALDFYLRFREPNFKDKSAKFVDKLSAIGGTMGLLTGFSIISGVKILYFAAKIIINYLRKLKTNLD